MRLINVDTFEMCGFNETNTPKYAILSHTWIDGQEVSYQDMIGLHKFSQTRRRSGFAKIQNCARQAKRDGLNWIWVDTCCIDKSSSAELSEAINSMYAYYRDSEVCYAYLADVPDDPNPDWPTRNHYLLEYYSSTWSRIWSRSELAPAVSDQTRIPKAVLNGETDPSEYPMAVRISWAAGRKTTRSEDIAYCLMGLLGVNTPLLYGEGTKAFARLQQEVIELSPDQSIFAWDFVDKGPDPRSCISSVLADSPDNFSKCSDLRLSSTDDGTPLPASTSFAMSNLGLQVQLWLESTDDAEVDYAYLDAFRGDERVKIPLKLLRQGVYVRIADVKVTPMEHKGALQSITICHRYFPPPTYFYYASAVLNGQEQTERLCDSLQSTFMPSSCLSRRRKIATFSPKHIGASISSSPQLHMWLESRGKTTIVLIELKNDPHYCHDSASFTTPPETGLLDPDLLYVIPPNWYWRNFNCVLTDHFGFGHLSKFRCRPSIKAGLLRLEVEFVTENARKLTALKIGQDFVGEPS